MKAIKLYFYAKTQKLLIVQSSEGKLERPRTSDFKYLNDRFNNLTIMKYRNTSLVLY